jgi:hypothetical protein
MGLLAPFSLLAQQLRKGPVAHPAHRQASTLASLATAQNERPQHDASATVGPACGGDGSGSPSSAQRRLWAARTGGSSLWVGCGGSSWRGWDCAADGCYRGWAWPRLPKFALSGFFFQTTPLVITLVRSPWQNIGVEVHGGRHGGFRA